MNKLQKAFNDPTLFWGWVKIRWTTFFKHFCNESYQYIGLTQLKYGPLFREVVDLGAHPNTIFLRYLTFDAEIEEDEGDYRGRLVEMGIGIVRYYHSKTKRIKYKPIRIGDTTDWQRMRQWRGWMFGREG